MLLLSHGADVNAKYMSSSPLHMALGEPTNIDIEIVISLLNRGANVSLQDRNGSYPMNVLGANTFYMRPEDSGFLKNMLVLHGVDSIDTTIPSSSSLKNECIPYTQK
ncbi:MAG: hypothetical protein K2X94_05330 [Amoebophilaceae bacterium]|nr:hypothetical protein [Amoebophilaceae bacterium]